MVVISMLTINIARQTKWITTVAQPIRPLSAVLCRPGRGRRPRYGLSNELTERESALVTGDYCLFVVVANVHTPFQPHRVCIFEFYYLPFCTFFCFRLRYKHRVSKRLSLELPSVLSVYYKIIRIS